MGCYGDQHDIEFTEPTDVRFIKLTVTTEFSAGGQSIVAIGEFDVLVKE